VHALEEVFQAHHADGPQQREQAAQQQQRADSCLHPDG